MKFGILVSGIGTNLQALLDAEARGELAPAVIAAVISNNADAPALEHAQAAGKPTQVIDHRHRDRTEFEAALHAALAAHGVEAVVLAGFMRVLSAQFLDHYPRRVINTHPSLLPAFPGIDAPRQTIAYGAMVGGVTIHFVDPSVDGGPIIAQAAVPVMPDDDAASLHARIQIEEHRLLPPIVRKLAAGTIRCDGRRVRLAH